MSDVIRGSVPKPCTLTYLIDGEALINGEGGKVLPPGRVEKFFYYIKNHVEGGIFFKSK